MCLYKNVILCKHIDMIQRIQSLYMVFIIFINVIYKIVLDTFQIFIFPEYLLFINGSIPIYEYLIPTISITLISIFFFKKRNIQLILNKINIFYQLVLILITLYNFLSLDFFHVIAISNIILFIMANRRIIDDKDLIKSLNRLR